MILLILYYSNSNAHCPTLLRSTYMLSLVYKADDSHHRPVDTGLTRSSPLVTVSSIFFSLICTENIFTESYNSSATLETDLFAISILFSILSNSKRSLSMSTAVRQAEEVSTSVSRTSAKTTGAIPAFSGIYSAYQTQQHSIVDMST